MKPIDILEPGVPGPSHSRPNLDPDAPDGDEEGEEMDDTNEDDAAMMAMMGMAGFGSTKVCVMVMIPIMEGSLCVKGKLVEGNQEGGASVKKVRTWRQYMNRYLIKALFLPIALLTCIYIQTGRFQQVRYSTFTKLLIIYWHFDRPLDKIK